LKLRVFLQRKIDEGKYEKVYFNKRQFNGRLIPADTFGTMLNVDNIVSFAPKHSIDTSGIGC
jgi:hypothetical protein